MSDDVSFADVADAALSFSRNDPAESLILELIDTRWFQRLRDISQTADTKLVYMFSEHSRFGHCIGVAHLACRLMEKLARSFKDDVEPYRAAVGAAALLHDIGHLAPGSHAAQRAWFPDQKDSHERIAVQILTSDPEISGILQEHDPQLPQMIAKILQEDASLPPWTWEIISGGGWNVDRGNWCLVDSILAGVSYGKYNVPALTGAIVLTEDKHLALRENRLDAMLHFAISRQAMYRQVYQHRVLLACDTLSRAIIKRARELSQVLEHADPAMRRALRAGKAEDLDLDTIFWMRESWWRYHLARWCEEDDSILADLADRILHRRLLKTMRVMEDDSVDELHRRAADAAEACGYNPSYYVHRVSAFDMNAGDSARSILVRLDNGRFVPFHQSEPLYGAMLNESRTGIRTWLAVPAEVKERLGRRR